MPVAPSQPRISGARRTVAPLLLGLLLVTGAALNPRPARHAAAAGLIYCVGPGSGHSGGANPNDTDFTDTGQALALAGDGDSIRIAVGAYAAITIAAAVTITGGYPGGNDGYCCAHAETGTTIGGTPAITVQSGQPQVSDLDANGIQVNGGTLTFFGNGTSSGVFNIATGAAVALINGNCSLADGTSFTGGGPGQPDGHAEHQRQLHAGGGRCAVSRARGGAVRSVGGKRHRDARRCAAPEPAWRLCAAGRQQLPGADRRRRGRQLCHLPGPVPGQHLLPADPDRCRPDAHGASLPLVAATQACPSPLTYPDVNNSGSVDAVDALCVLRFVAALPATQACPLSS